MEDVADTAGRASGHAPRPVSRYQVFWRMWMPVLLYCAIIFIASSIPARDMPAGRFWQLDKLVHAVVYGGLALLLYRGFASHLARRRARRPRLLAGGLAVATSVAYGISDEWHQSFVPGRTATVGDVLADGLGAVLCVGAAIALQRYWKRVSDLQ